MQSELFVQQVVLGQVEVQAWSSACVVVVVRRFEDCAKPACSPKEVSQPFLDDERDASESRRGDGREGHDDGREHVGAHGDEHGHEHGDEGDHDHEAWHVGADVGELRDDEPVGADVVDGCMDGAGTCPAFHEVHTC